jgi:UTP:GlnB (protein PII) uridylyltransferase
VAKEEHLTKKTKPLGGLEQFAAQNSRLELLKPATFEADPDAWLVLAPINSIEGDKAQAAIIAKEKALAIDTTRMTDAEYMEYTFQRSRELAARLIVEWNNEYFGELSVERASEVMEKYRAIYVQVDLHLKNTRNFFKA